MIGLCGKVSDYAGHAVGRSIHENYFSSGLLEGPGCGHAKIANCAGDYCDFLFK
jgi:hypothetical protein